MAITSIHNGGVVPAFDLCTGAEPEVGKALLPSFDAGVCKPRTVADAFARNGRPVLFCGDAEEPDRIGVRGLPIQLPSERLDARVADLLQAPSVRGARDFEGDMLAELTLERFGSLTARGVRTIQALVDELDLPPGHIVLFRGQKRPGGLCHLPEDPAECLTLIESELRTGAAERKRDLRGHRHHEVLASNKELHRRTEKWLENATSIDDLMGHHRRTYGSRLLVSASRSLSVAAGDYNMRTSQNQNRFIHILSVPATRCLNFRGVFRTKGTVVYDDPSVVDRPGNANCDLEAEVDVLFDARPYLVATYDAVEDELLE